MKPIDSHSPHLKIAAAAFAAAMFTLGVTACGGSDDSSETGSDSWRIGLEAPLSGDLQTLGEGMLNGAELAADQINADGGLEGKDIQIVPIDDAGDPATGVKAAENPRSRMASMALSAPTTRASASKPCRWTSTRGSCRSG